jgi:hypothetical protein
MTDKPDDLEPNDRRMRLTYALVVVVEVVVIAALWGFSRYFAS